MSNPFNEGLTLAQLQALQTAYLDCITALASNMSYSLNGRSITRSSLPHVMEALGQINAALALKQGNTSQQTYVSFTGL